ncbi:MAG: lysophospholipid acyltransferase family protein [Bacteroidota bacterium]
MKAALGVVRFVMAVVNSMFFATLELIVIVAGKNDRVFHALARGWAHTTLLICGVKVNVRGLEKVTRGRSYVYVSNHASMFDIPAVLASVPDQIRILYKKELNWIPIFGWGLKYGSYIAIDRRRGAEAMKSLEEAAKKIRTGASALLYAEGTRTLDGKLQPFKRGAFNLAMKAGVPVVPLTINGSYRLLPKRSIVVQPGEVELVLESPIEIKGAGKEEEMRLMDEVRAAIQKHYVEQS